MAQQDSIEIKVNVRDIGADQTKQKLDAISTTSDKLNSKQVKVSVSGSESVDNFSRSLRRASTEADKMQKEADQASNSLKKVADSANTSSGGLTNFAQKVGALYTSFLAFRSLGSVFEGALDLAQSAGALQQAEQTVKQIFKETPQAEKEFKNLSSAFGIASSSGLQMANQLGAIQKGAGQTEAEAFKNSKAWLTLAGDLSAFMDVPIEEALTAVRAGITGETEPLKRLGINLTEASLKQDGFNATMTETEKQLVRIKSALRQADSAGITGQYGRELETNLTAQFDQIKAKWENLKAFIGKNSGLFDTVLSKTKEFSGALSTLLNDPSLTRSLLEIPKQFLSGVVKPLQDGFKVLEGAFKKFSTAIGANGKTVEQQIEGYQKLANTVGVLIGTFAGFKILQGATTLIKNLGQTFANTTTNLNNFKTNFGTGFKSIITGFTGVSNASTRFKLLLERDFRGAAMAVDQQGGLVNGLKNIGVYAKNALTSFTQGGGFGVVSAALGLAATQAGDLNAKMALTAGSTALLGVQIGLAFGPWGALIGGVAGLLAGLKISQDEVTAAQQRTIDKILEEKVLRGEATAQSVGSLTTISNSLREQGIIIDENKLKEEIASQGALNLFQKKADAMDKQIFLGDKFAQTTREQAEAIGVDLAGSYVDADGKVVIAIGNVEKYNATDQAGRDAFLNAIGAQNAQREGENKLILGNKKATEEKNAEQERAKKIIEDYTNNGVKPTEEATKNLNQSTKEYIDNAIKKYDELKGKTGDAKKATEELNNYLQGIPDKTITVTINYVEVNKPNPDALSPNGITGGFSPFTFGSPSPRSLDQSFAPNTTNITYNTYNNNIDNSSSVNTTNEFYGKLGAR